jgi:hypothetical protein
MRRKIFGILVCMLLILTLSPTMNATSANYKPLAQKNETFKNCYIKCDGLLELGNVMHKIIFLRNNDNTFVFFWLIEWDNFNTNFPTTVTIYSEKNGQVLWNNDGIDGIWGLHLIVYKGSYTQSSASDGRLILHIEGNARLAITHTEA